MPTPTPQATDNLVKQARNLDAVARDLCKSLRLAGETLRTTRKEREEGGVGKALPTVVWEVRWHRRTRVLAMPRYDQCFSDAGERKQAERQG